MILSLPNTSSLLDRKDLRRLAARHSTARHRRGRGSAVPLLDSLEHTGLHRQSPTNEVFWRDRQVPEERYRRIPAACRRPRWEPRPHGPTDSPARPDGRTCQSLARPLGVHSGTSYETCSGSSGTGQRSLCSFEPLLRLAAEVPQVSAAGAPQPPVVGPNRATASPDRLAEERVGSQRLSPHTTLGSQD